MATTIGRRVATVGEIERAGDYCGPITGYTGPTGEACFFYLPIPLGSTPDAGKIHHVGFPPHTYRECSDGSLEIRASIGAYGHEWKPGEGYVWHGYLDEGHVWREC